MGDSVQAALPEEPAKVSEVQKQRRPAGIPENMSTSPLERADQCLEENRCLVLHGACKHIVLAGCDWCA